MSQRKAKEYRQAMEQYQGVVEDIGDLKHRLRAMEARHRQEDQEKEEREWKAERQRKNERRRQIVRRRRIATVVCLAALLVVLVLAVVMACTAEGTDRPTATTTPVAVIRTTDVEDQAAGEDPLEAEKIEAALLEQGYFSDAIPLHYDLQDLMRTACEEYGCPYSLALAVAEVESHFDMEAVGAVGEVGIMQLNPGPGGAYHAELEAVTGLDPTTPSGNIAAGCYLLGKYIADYEDPQKAAMAYNMGVGGAKNAWAEGITSTNYTEKVMEAAARWAEVAG